MLGRLAGDGAWAIAASGLKKYRNRAYVVVALMKSAMVFV
jgi:hypothetical protein